MEFSTICKVVNEHMDQLSLSGKVKIFKDVFNYPIDFKEDKYYYSSFEWDEQRMKDFISINIHWLNVGEFEKLYYFFTKKDPSQS
jgi:hypothetical protein